MIAVTTESDAAPSTTGHLTIAQAALARPLGFLVTRVLAGSVADHRLFVWDGDASSSVSSPLAVV